MPQQPGTAQTAPTGVHLSQEAYDRLAEELHRLKTDGRERAAHAIGIAREHGDIRENADYDAAKNEQGLMEARIRQLEAMLRDAVVGPAEAGDTASPGTVVTLDLAGEHETFFLGSREEAVNGMDVLSAQSALGQAVTGRKIGEEFSYTTPTGKELPVKLLEVRAGAG